MATILESKFKFYMDMCFLNGKKRRGKKSVTAKACQLLHFVFVCDFYMYGKWFSVFMEQSGMGNGQVLNFSEWFISKWKESSTATSFCQWNMDCLFLRVLCGVQSLPVLVPLYVPVLICHRKILQNTWSEFERSDWSTNYPNSQSEWRSSTSSV